MTKSAPLSLVTIAVAVSAVCAGARPAEAASYFQTNLVSNLSLSGAEVTDPALVNPWGITETTTSPFWVSDQGVNLTTLYMVTGSTTVTKVTAVFPPTGNIHIPTTASGPQGPTGTVANTSGSFQIPTPSAPTGTAPAHFIFANLNGTISAWNTTGTNASIQATTSGAVYTGLAISQGLTTPELYAANRTTGKIDVFNSSFQPVAPPGNFIDPTLPGGLVPFNVQDIGGKVYVTYAPSNPATAIAGQGVVSVFDENGNFIQRVATGASLAHRGVLPLLRPVSAHLAVIFWLAISVSTASAPSSSIQQPGSSTSQARLQSTAPVVYWRLSSEMGRPAAIPTRSTSPIQPR
jgi:uncharacterized protein (TIGR03118 family)